MPGFNEIFGGTTIAPAQATFLQLNMTANVELAWPIEQALSGLVVADTIEINSATPGLDIEIPDARHATQGYTTLVNNLSAETVTVRDALGGVIISPTPGSAWVIYLADNSTEAGTWRSFQLGASVSVAAAAALAGSGLKAVLTTLAQDLPVTSFAATPTTLVDSDRAKCYNWTGGVGVLNLPGPGAVGNGWFVLVRNTGSGNLTVTPPSGTIDSGGTKVFAPGASGYVLTDGTNFFTVGFGTGASGGGSFDFVEIDVAGSGNFDLAGANLNRIAYRFIGVLTGNRTIRVPGTIQQYWISNATTGAFSLFVKTVPQAAPGIEVQQGGQAILYCDGNNVVDAESSSVSFPIPVAQGGTGSNTAAGARTNLGAGTTGANIFTSATQANAQSALGLALAAANTYSVSPQTISAADVSWELNETDGAANNRLWAVRVNGEQLTMGAWNDARGSYQAFMTVDRTLNVIDIIALAAATLSFGGSVLTPNTSAFEVGFKGLPLNSQSGNYAPVLNDAGKGILHPSGAGAGDTYTIPANSSVAFPVGTVLTFINGDSNPLSIAITTDTLTLIGTTTTGTRSLAQNGVATAIKIGATSWLIGGTGLT